MHVFRLFYTIYTMFDNWPKGCMFLGCFTQYILCLTTEQKVACFYVVLHNIYYVWQLSKRLHVFMLFYTIYNMFDNWTKGCMFLCCFTQYILCLTTEQNVACFYVVLHNIYYVWQLSKTVLAVDDRHVAFCEYNGSVARIICVAVATLANEKLLERASDNDLLLCRSQLRIKRVIDNDLIDV